MLKLLLIVMAVQQCVEYLMRNQSHFGITGQLKLEQGFQESVSENSGQIELENEN